MAIPTATLFTEICEAAGQDLECLDLQVKLQKESDPGEEEFAVMESLKHSINPNVSTVAGFLGKSL